MDFLTTTALSPPQSPQSPTSDFRKIHTASKKATDESLAWLRSQTNANSKTGLFKHLDLAKQAQRKGTEMPESIQQRLEEAISKRLWVLDVHASQFGADEQHANCIELLADILFTFCPEKRPPSPTTIYEADSNICEPIMYSMEYYQPELPYLPPPHTMWAPVYYPAADSCEPCWWTTPYGMLTPEYSDSESIRSLSPDLP